MNELDDYVVFTWKCKTCDHQFVHYWNSMDMKHNFDRFFKCDVCECLYYINCYENVEITNVVFNIFEDEYEQGSELERYLSPCSCGGRLVYYSPRCPQCGENDVNKFIELKAVQANHEIIYTKLKSKRNAS